MKKSNVVNQNGACSYHENSRSIEPVVQNPKMRVVYETIEIMRDFDTNVIISGESGTGKSLLAKMIYVKSPRASEAFIEVNCGSLNDQLLESELFGHVRGAFTGAVSNRAGKIEEAKNGTLFLDDITSASLSMQTKLLHVLENRCIQRVGDNCNIFLNTRFICATNQDIVEEVKAGRFREDLYYRVSVINLKLPPLRERPDEIIPLVNYYIDFYNHKFGCGYKGLKKSDFQKALSYFWPGNVRELKNAIERSCVLSRGEWVKLDLNNIEAFQTKYLGENKRLSLKQAVTQYEKKFIYEALDHYEWDIDKTSESLKIGRSTLFSKIKKHNLKNFCE